MKLIIAGASGFVGRELLHQSLAHPAITSVIAISRSAVKTPENSDASKLRAVQVDDYGNYSEETREAFEGAGACIWTVAITPTKSKGVDFEIVKKVCQTDTVTGLQTIYESLGPSKQSLPFRFMYISGVAAERDQTKTPEFMPQYCLMRGETENQVLAFAAQHAGQVEACVSKPGMITDPNREETTQRALEMSRTMGLPFVSVVDMSAAMLSQCVNGFEKEPLENADLVRIGQSVLRDDRK